MASARAKTRVPVLARPFTEQAAAITVLFAVAYLPLVSGLDGQISLYVYLSVAIRLAALRWPVVTPGRWLMLPLTAGALINVYHAYHGVVGQEGGTALLVSMLALKLLEARQVRDLRLVAMLLSFLFVTQFLFDKSLPIALFFAVLLVLDFAILADLCRRAPVGPVRKALMLSLKLTLQALPLTLILFVLFPRLEAPLWNLFKAEDRAKTGVKPWLEPGNVSELVVDGSLAFRVRFDGSIPGADSLYWRGPVVWNTDGRRWLPAEPGQFPGLEYAPEAATDLTSYEVSLEPSGQRFLFALDIPTSTPEQDAKITHDLQVLATEKISEERVYRLTSALTYHTGEISLDEEIAGLQLPGNVTERMRALVATWKTRTTGPAELVAEGLKFFNREEFHYTLLPPRLGSNPADEFLFETRKGFCEHYASSFALLMRIGGIPSRIVLGYMGGERNPLGGHLIVRQSDAHAWTEVWLAGRGWVRVDPTAAVAPHRIERSEILAGLGSGSPLRFRVHESETLVDLVHRLKLLADAIDEGWRHWVVELDRKRQLNMLEWMGLGFLREYGLALVMTVASAVVLGLLMLALMRSGGDADLSPAERLYLRFCRRLGRMGLVHHSSEGPLDYGQRVARARPDLAEPVEAFTELYARMHYGGASLSQQNLDRLRANLAKVGNRRDRRRRGSGTG